MGQLDNLWFDFDVFEKLMDKTISWSGNFRQLQSLAKRSAYNILQDKENKEPLKAIKNGKEDSFVHISFNHIKDVMKEFF